MQQRPISVTVFGILNIGFGFFDLFVTLLSMFVLPGMSAATPLLKQMHDNHWTRITMPLDGIAAVVLLAAGIGLLLSQNWARIVSIIDGIYSIVTCIVGGIMTLMSDTSGIMMIVSLIATVGSLVYPVLLIIFMTRPNVVAALKPAPPLS
jgi:membrane-bound ClpP family serine protease